MPETCSGPCSCTSASSWPCKTGLPVRAVTKIISAWVLIWSAAMWVSTSVRKSSTCSSGSLPVTAPPLRVKWATELRPVSQTVVARMFRQPTNAHRPHLLSQKSGVRCPVGLDVPERLVVHVESHGLVRQLNARRDRSQVVGVLVQCLTPDFVPRLIDVANKGHQHELAGAPAGLVVPGEPLPQATRRSGSARGQGAYSGHIGRVIIYPEVAENDQVVRLGLRRLVRIDRLLGHFLCGQLCVGRVCQRVRYRLHCGA